MAPEDIWDGSLLAVLLALLFVAFSGSVGAGAPGLQVVGLLSATDTERAEFMVAIGNDILCQFKDEAIFTRQIGPLIGQDVELTLRAK